MSTKDLPDFLGGETVSTAPAEAPAVIDAPAIETAAPAEAPATPTDAPATAGGPARGPDGKFAPATPPAEAAPIEAAPAAPVVAPTPEPHSVPLPTFLDMRDKLSASEKEARELREWRAQQEAARLRQPIPDPTTDPDGHRRFVDATTQATLENMQLEHRREISRIRAEVTHGKDTVDQAFAWADQQIQSALDAGQPSALNDQIKRHGDPIGLVVDEWKRSQVLSKISDPSRLDAFLAWEAAQAAAPAPGVVITPTPTPQAAPAAPPAAPRPSLASAPSASSTAAPIPRDGGATFDVMFGP